MAQDNAPSVRQKKQLERKCGRRASYDRILIVSEGSQTEPNYFKEIRSTYRLHTAHVVVRPSELGTEPIQVVQYAQHLFEKGDPHKKIQPRAFEQVYAVFDRDDHRRYSNALDKAKSLDRKLRNDARQSVIFQAIASVPCFELWLLLHFEDIHSSQSRRDVIQRLKRHIPSYEKGINNAFEITRKHLPEAIGRAERLARIHTAYSDGPFTAVVDLVKLLKALHN